MNTIKNSMRLAKIFALALSVVIFFFPSVAMADSFQPPCVDIKDGRAIVSPPPYTVKEGFEEIRSSVVQVLGDNFDESAELDSLMIVNMYTGDVVYDCDNSYPITFRQGDDLIRACQQGPARLGNPGDQVMYMAAVEGAQPNKNVEFCVSLGN